MKNTFFDSIKAQIAEVHVLLLCCLMQINCTATKYATASAVGKKNLS